VNRHHWARLTAAVVALTLTPMGCILPAAAQSAATGCTARTDDAGDGSGPGMRIGVPDRVVAAADPHLLQVRLQSGAVAIDDDVTLVGPALLGVLGRCLNGSWTENYPTAGGPGTRETWNLGHVNLSPGRAVVFNVRYSLGPANWEERSLPAQPQDYPFDAHAGGLHAPTVQLSAGGISVDTVTPATGCPIDGTAVFGCDFTVSVRNYAEEDTSAELASWSMHWLCPDCNVVTDAETIQTASGSVDSVTGFTGIDVGTVPASGHLEVPIHVRYVGIHGQVTQGFTVVRPVVGQGYLNFGATFDIRYADRGSATVPADSLGETCRQKAVTVKHAQGPPHLSIKVPQGVRAAADAHHLLVRVRAGQHSLDGQVKLVSPFGRGLQPLVEWCRGGLMRPVPQERLHHGTFNHDKFLLGLTHVPAHRIARFYLRYTLALPSRQSSFPHTPLDFPFVATQKSRTSPKAVMTLAGFAVTRVTPSSGCAINGTSVTECDLRLKFVNRAGETAPLWLFLGAGHQQCDNCAQVDDDVLVHAPAGDSHSHLVFLGDLVPGTPLHLHIRIRMQGDRGKIVSGGLFARPDFERPGDPRGADYNREATAEYNSGGSSTGPIGND